MLDFLSVYSVSVIRLGAGMFTGKLGPRPEKPLELYEFEGCPYCRKVREVMSILDLSAKVHPCPKNGTRFRPTVIERGGKALFPYLIDPNTGQEMYESDQIISYLFERYGAGRPLHYSIPPLHTLGSALASSTRPIQGIRAKASKAPEKPLELYSFEASPYCRWAREALCELELPYLLHNVAKKSPSRAEFIKRSGKMQVPYLVDPNTNTEMFESRDIVRYLHQTYGA